MTSLTELKAAYNASKMAIMDHPLTAEEQSKYRAVLADLPANQDLSVTDRKLLAVYRALMESHLAEANYQLFSVVNLNHDHTWLTYPIEPARIARWQADQDPKFSLFSANAFLYDGISIDETAALALL